MIFWACSSNFFSSALYQSLLIFIFLLFMTISSFWMPDIYVSIIDTVRQPLMCLFIDLVSEVFQTVVLVQSIRFIIGYGDII